jgi:diphthamide biosynthesis methyltransferase
MAPSLALELLQKAQTRQLKDKMQTASSLRASKSSANVLTLSPSTPLFVLWHVGWPDEKIWAGTLENYPHALDDSNEPPGPAVLILPGKMHFCEEDSWKQAQENF